MTRRTPIVATRLAVCLTLMCSAAPLISGPLRPMALPCPASALASCVAARLQVPHRWRPGTRRLDYALAAVAVRAGVPVSMVLSAPIPEVDLPPGSRSAASLLVFLAGVRRDYSWHAVGGVIWFVDRRFAHDPRNPLNRYVGSFSLLPDLNRTFLRLRQTLTEPRARPGQGETISDLTGPIGGTLPSQTLRNRTVAQILQHVMEAAPTFYSEVEFPHEPPLSRADALAALASWQWVPLDRPPVPPLPPPPPPIRVPRG